MMSLPPASTRSGAVYMLTMSLRLTYGDDAAVLDGNAGVLNDAAILVHGYKRAVKHQEIYSRHAPSPVSLRGCR